MEAQPPSGSGSSSAAYPRWVMLEQYMQIKVEDSSFCSASATAARTSAGNLIQVSLRLAEPPALSSIFLLLPDGANKEKSKVLAAHGDSVLIQVLMEQKYERYTVDHFVYNAAEPPRPPSLWLLPPYYEERYFSSDLDSEEPDLVPRKLSADATGLLRRGEDELVVAELSDFREGHLYLFRSGEWNYHRCGRPRPSDLGHVRWNAVVAVDDRLLCWVDWSNGVALLDVFKEEPTMRYVRLPMDPRGHRNVCVTAGGGTLKFVNIFDRCCCGAAACCDCKHSRHAYTIHTWTMRTPRVEGGMEWVKDGMVDATELWALDAYKDLPCGPLDRPVVSLDEPEVICFRLRDTEYGSRTLWQIMVNMRSKTILSVSRYEEEVGSYCYIRDNKLIPSKVSYFFNTYPFSSGRSDDDAASTSQNQIDIKRSPSVAVDEQPNGEGDCSNTTLQPFSTTEPSMQASEIFEAFEEIASYGLGPDEVKAYRILSSHNGCRLRSLLRLPKDVRKDWLLMEIKASDAS